MKITEVRVILTCPTRNYLFVKILTDEGVYGVGEGTLNGSELAVATAIEHAAELLIGRDPMRTEDLWQLIYNWSYWRAGPIYMSALGALDLALWDIKGKVAGLPVYELIGGKSRDGVLTYGHADGSDPSEVADNVRVFLDRGYKVVRAQQGGYGGSGVVRREAPLRRNVPGEAYFDAAPYLAETPKLFEHLRAELGDEVELLHDVHEQLTPNQAAWLAKQLEPYRLFYLEDPLPPEHYESFRVVREASTTSLAMGEVFTSRWDCIRLFAEQLIDYIRIKPIHVGGITEARKIMVFAEPAQIRSAFHGAGDIGPVGQAASLHLQISIPNFGVQEWIDFGTEGSARLREVTPNPCEWRDGYAYPHEAPGLGMDVDEEAASRYPYRKAYLPIIRRVDGTMHRH
jgi:mannonate dehydratase